MTQKAAIVLGGQVLLSFVLGTFAVVLVESRLSR